jgi:hypothetical protein
MNAMNGVDVIYWINLDRSHDRRDRMNKVFEDPVFNGIEIIRFSAIDCSVENLDTYILNKDRPQTKVEYCCLLSHMECIRMFSNQSQHKNALIMEDDVTLDYKKYWKSSVSDVMNNAPIGWECLMLSYMSNRVPSELYAYNTDNHWSCLSYVVPLNSAKKIINDCYDTSNKKYLFDKSISHEADKYIFLKLITYVYRYPFFIYGYDENSTLQHQGAIKFHNSSRKRIDEMYSNVGESSYRGDEEVSFYSRINPYIFSLLLSLISIFCLVVYIVINDSPVTVGKMNLSTLVKCMKCGPSGRRN